MSRSTRRHRQGDRGQVADVEDLPQMTAERAVLIGMQPNQQVDDLVGDVLSAAARARKADGGDRFDIARFEALATQLEQMAVSASGSVGHELPPGLEVSNALLVG